MPTMSGAEQLFCRSAPWQWWTCAAVLPWALQGVKLHGDVLEIGAGGGAMAAGALSTHPGLRLTLTDIDTRMVAATARRLGHRGDVRFQQADATRLPFADGSFDYCVSYLMLHHIIGCETALAEVRRVLRPGGRLVGYDLTDTRLARTIHFLDRSPHRLITPGELRAESTRVGFHNVHVRTAFAGHVVRFIASQTFGSQ